MKILLVKWLFGIKKDGTRKACLVVVGCKDPEKYTPADLASPTPSFDMIRLLLAYVSTTSCELVAFDIKTAFLHGDIDCEKYISLPPGISGNRQEKVCKLNKALYGLRTAPKCWFRIPDKYSQSVGFVPSVRERCLYTKKSNTLHAILLVYVDDILLLTLTEGESEVVFHLLGSKFEVKCIGFPTNFLGLDICRNSVNKISICQKTFILETLKKFSMFDSHPVRNPLVKNMDYTLLIRGESELSFKSSLGHLMWVCHTRPDIEFATNYLA